MSSKRLSTCEGKKRKKRGGGAAVGIRLRREFISVFSKEVQTLEKKREKN